MFPVLVVLALALVLQQGRIVFGVLGRFTNVDQVILWAAARDWGRLVVHQPNYFGQDYGTTFEGIPIELLHGLGVRFATAVPLALAAMTVASWLALAGVAWKRGHGVVAVLALAAPLVMSSYYAFYTTFYGAATGRFLVVLGTSIVLVIPPRRWVLFGCGWALITFGLAIDPSAAILGAPVLVYLLFDSGWQRGRVAAAAIGSLPALAWLVGIRLFDRVHPDYVIFKVDVQPTVLGFKRNLSHPSRLWGMFSPDLVRQWWILPIAMVVLVGLLLASRRWRLSAPALTVVAVVAVATAMEFAGVATVRSVLLPESRIMLAMPFAAWFLALLASEHYEVSLRHARVALAVVAAVALVTAGVRAVDFRHRVDSIAVISTGQFLANGLVPVDAVERECAAGARFARQHRVGLVVYEDNVLTYACAGIDAGPQTLNDLIERRTWRLAEEQAERRNGLLLWGPPAARCTTALQRVGSCELLRRGHVPVALVKFRSESSLEALKSLGIFVRGFGPDCHPIPRPGSEPFLQCR